MNCERIKWECPNLILPESTTKYIEFLSAIKGDVSFIVEHLWLDLKKLKQNERELSKLKSSDSNLIEIISRIKNVITNQQNLSEETSKKLQNKLQKLEEENLKLKKDKLTWLLNRQTFDGNYLELVSSWKEFSLAIIDLDDFKTINDSHWHPTGDAVLKNIAKLLQNIFPEESLYRFWWEEFIILFQNKSNELFMLLNDLLLSLNKKLFKTKDSQFRVTFSWWIKQFAWEPCFEAIYSSIDKLLYTAKLSWKNRIEIW